MSGATGAALKVLYTLRKASAHAATCQTSVVRDNGMPVQVVHGRVATALLLERMRAAAWLTAGQVQTKAQTL